MAIRLSGISSGLDTDAIVQELVSAYSLKTQKYEKAQTKLSWKQDAWKSLNTKIYSLYSSVSNMRLSSSYSLKKVTVSDSTKATVTASSTAPIGTQSLEVKKLAQACYMTGDEVSLASGGKVTGDTKLSELGYTGSAAKIDVVREDGTKGTIEIQKGTTVSEFVKELQNNGLNASFDEANQRIFASAKQSGTENNFILMGNGKDGADALRCLGLDTALVKADGTFTELGAQYYQADYDLFDAAGKAGYKTISGLQTYIEQQIAAYDKLESQQNAANARDSIYDTLETLGLRPSRSDLESVVKNTLTDKEGALKTYLSEKVEDKGALELVFDELYAQVSASANYANAASQIQSIFQDVYLLDRPSVTDLQKLIQDAGSDTDKQKTALKDYIKKETNQDLDDTSAEFKSLFTSLTELNTAGIDGKNATISDTRKALSQTLNELLPLDTNLKTITDSASLETYLIGEGINKNDIAKYSDSLLDNLTTIRLYEGTLNTSTFYDTVQSQLKGLLTDEEGNLASELPTIEELQTKLAGVSSDKQLSVLATQLKKYNSEIDVEEETTKTKLEAFLNNLNKINDIVPSEEREAYNTVNQAITTAGFKDGSTEITSIADLQLKIAGETEDGAKAWLKEHVTNTVLTDSDKETLAETLYESLKTISAYESSSADVTNVNVTDVQKQMNSSMVKDLAQNRDISKLDYEIYNKAVDAFEANRILNNEEYKSGGASRVDGQNSEISLNGVTFTGSSNSFNINGLAIEITGVTTDPVTITTNTDTQGIYDKIKDFLTEYNNVINEMTKLYNADSASDYEPLTDDEKAAMSDEQIEKWETKIKDSLLRRDTTLNSVMSVMINAMSSTYSINGKTLSLSSFGIKTLGFLNAPDNENYAYHIDGDEDDENTSGNEDKLMAAIQEDPDQIVEFMKKLTSGLYTAIDNKMKSTDLSSAYKVYNDKEMESQYKQYTSTISKWETKVSEKEEYYYNKFSQMEVALSKLESQSSSLSGLLGS